MTWRQLLAVLIATVGTVELAVAGAYWIHSVLTPYAQSRGLELLFFPAVLAMIVGPGVAWCLIYRWLDG